MATKQKTFVIRDLRQKSRYTIDDEYLNGYAKLCGVNATAVYNSLCRHASKNQECFPSLDLIMEQHGFGSKHTVIKAIKKLEEWGIIIVKKERDEKTKRQKNNVYMLCDKSSWNPKPGASNALRAECISDTDPGAFETQKPGAPNALEGNTDIKESHIRSSVADATPRICEHDECKKEAMRGVGLCEAHQPMNCLQFVEWYRKSPQRHIRIVAEFVDELRLAGIAPDLRTVAQWREFAAPSRATAVKLSVFDDDQLSSAMKRMMSAKWVTDFNLVTLKKFLINSNK